MRACVRVVVVVVVVVRGTHTRYRALCGRCADRDNSWSCRCRCACAVAALPWIAGPAAAPSAAGRQGEEMAPCFCFCHCPPARPAGGEAACPCGAAAAHHRGLDRAAASPPPAAQVVHLRPHSIHAAARDELVMNRPIYQSPTFQGLEVGQPRVERVHRRQAQAVEQQQGQRRLAPGQRPDVLHLGGVLRLGLRPLLG